jgi:surface polysaccharide O-acyltransferase-like enzyme
MNKQIGFIVVLDKLSSERLSLLRFPLIVGVVFIHAAGFQVNLNDGSSGSLGLMFIPDFIQNMLSHGVARISVPLFFCMSGYLFFLNFNFSVVSYTKKIKSRVDTLLIPFVFWNLLVIIVIFLGQSIPQLSAYFSGTKQSVITYTTFDFLNNLIGLTKLPIAYQFWFIRDLMVMVLLAPLIVVLLKFRIVATFMLFSLSVFWLFDLWDLYIPSSAAILFFYLGCYCSRFELNIFYLDRYGKIIIASYLLILLLDCLTRGFETNSLLHKVGIIFGLVSALYVTKFVCMNRMLKERLLNLASYSFFIFAAHEPILTIAKKIVYKTFLPESDVAVTFIYLSLPILIIIGLIIIYKGLHIIAPKHLRLISGGR